MLAHSQLFPWCSSNSGFGHFPIWLASPSHHTSSHKLPRRHVNPALIYGVKYIAPLPTACQSNDRVMSLMSVCWLEMRMKNTGIKWRCKSVINDLITRTTGVLQSRVNFLYYVLRQKCFLSVSEWIVEAVLPCSILGFPRCMRFLPGDLLGL